MKKRIIALTGFMGCGKSTVGRELAALTDAHFADLDSVIVRREGRTIRDIFSAGGEAAFRQAELEALVAFLDKAESIWKPSVLSLGGGTFCFPASRRILLERTESVYLRTSLEEIRSRIGGIDASRPLFKDADRLFAMREPLYSQASLVVDTTGKSVREVAELIRDTLFA